MKDLLQDRFVLISRWRLDCGIDVAWQHVSDVRDWPNWWPCVRAVRVDEDAQHPAAAYTPRAGNRATIDWKTPLGYGLRLHVTTTRVLAPFELEGVACGDLEGHGLWVLQPRHAERTEGLQITYRWDVHLTRRWMRWTSPLLRPLFARNHAAVMRNGAGAMARSIGSRLLHCEDFSVSPGVPAQAPHAPDPSAWN